MLSRYEVDPGETTPDWIVNEAHLVNDALSKGVIDAMEATHGLEEDEDILDVMKQMVDVTYFVEFPPENVDPAKRGEAILDMLWQPVVVEDEEGGLQELPLFKQLARQGRALSITMSTLDDATAEAVKLLDDHGVPVSAWIVTEDRDGYWTNKTNIAQTAQKTREVMKWIDENNLQIKTLGFDLEKPLDYLKGLSNLPSGIRDFTTARRLYSLSKDLARWTDGDPDKQFKHLLEEVEQAGFDVEFYTMPRPMKGVLADMQPPAGSREIEMAYTSDMPAIARRGGRALRFMLSPGVIPALGIVSGRQDETPGRALREGGPGHHLTQTELTQHFEALLGKSSSLAQRELGLRAVYLFALNDASVEQMTDASLAVAFDRLA